MNAKLRLTRVASRSIDATTSLVFEANRGMAVSQSRSDLGRRHTIISTRKYLQ